MRKKVKILLFLILMSCAGVSLAQKDSIDILFSQYEAAIKYNATAKGDKINTEIIAQKALEAVYESKSIDRLTEYYQTFVREEKYAQEAKRIRDKLAFEQTQNDNTIEAYEEFLRLYPDAVQAALVQLLIDQKMLEQYSERKDLDSLLIFANSVTDKELATKALAEVDKISFERALVADRADNYADYLSKHPSGTYILIAKDKYDKALLRENLTQYKVSTLINFLEKHPNHPSYSQLLDTLKCIAIAKSSNKGMDYYYQKTKKENDTTAKYNFGSQQPNEIKQPKKPVMQFATTALPAYDAVTIDSIDILPLRSAFSDTDFFIFDNGNSVIFASNREDGYGTDGYKATKEDTLNSPFDLYIAFKTKGQWKEPMLLPKPINSTASERKPVLSVDKKMLLFSSCVYETYGNEDIYLSYRTDTADWSNWSVPLHLSYEINTNRDDYVAEFNGSNMIIKQDFNPSKGSFRRLSTKNNEPMFNLKSGYARDIDAKPAFAKIILIDNTTNKPFDSIMSNNTTGFFAFLSPAVSFSVIGLGKGCIPALLQPSQMANDSSEISLQLNNINTLIEKNKIQPLENLIDESEPKKLPNIAKLYLNYLAKELAELPQTISISVFCSNGTKDLSAQDLAQTQASLIKSALITNGIKSEKIVAVGFEHKRNADSQNTTPKSRIEIGFISNQ
ncbi:MAG: hypothetical protein LBO06_00255 [Bacteroidales bacterium]|jgi:hypothetical protein|nr:hypothetical protein [Bacteroidales bacterium]